jgi:hypothetical protein
MVGKKFKDYKKNQVPLTPEERAEVKKLKAEWSSGDSAVWKSIDKKTGEVTYITHTHRAFNTAPTLKGAIGRFHSFIKSTASENVDNSMEKVAKKDYTELIKRMKKRRDPANIEKCASEHIPELDRAFSHNPLARKVAYMIATSHEYKKPNIDAALSFVKNYDWELSKADICDLQGINKPVDEVKVQDMAKNMTTVKPFIAVNKFQGITPQSKGKLMLIDGHHRQEACKLQGKTSVPIYKGTYTGAAELTRKELMEKKAMYREYIEKLAKKRKWDGDISRYIGEDGSVNRTLMSLDARYRDLNRADIERLSDIPTVKASFFGKTSFDKIPLRKLSEDYLEQMSYGSVAEHFNKEYLLHLNDMAEGLHKKKILTRAGIGTGVAGVAGAGIATAKKIKAIKLEKARQLRNKRLGVAGGVIGAGLLAGTAYMSKHKKDNIEKTAMAMKGNRNENRAGKIREAGSNNLMVQITYTDKKGNTSTRTVEPYKIDGEDFWGYDPAKENIRRFKMSKVKGIKPTKQTFSPRWPMELGEPTIADAKPAKKQLTLFEKGSDNNG